MGGRGAYSETGIVTLANASINMPQLEKAIDERMSELSEIMLETSWDATGYPQGVPGTTAENAARYRRALDEYQDLQQKRRQLNLYESAQKASTRNMPVKAHTFVNSYGESTTREITSGTYERAQRALEREIRTFLGSGLVR